ncbi:MAG: asparagine synthase (glutamine-hydrolyzing) [Bacilli bacterium]|nr:asparagine synthase (glutamine-hydrolyzing) [Bacilli bacterium]
MCGFCGYINNKEKDYIKEMNDAIIHRGPDDESYYKDENIAMGFRRLSIIDLQGGRQPISNEDDTMIITFNGEIYNFKEIKEDLIQKGHKFKTKTDTEVILQGYIEYKEKILDKLRGMFAFVIWDKNNKKLFGARDHFGQKPFYYANMNGTFMYSSEIKSLLHHPDFIKEVNKEALKPYLTFQTSVLDETFFKGVYKLRPGHYFTYDIEKDNLEIKEYYNINFKPEKQDFDDLVNTIDKTITKSIDYHIISDVPVGAYLSGGIDSSYVVSYLKPDKTFSVGFDYKDFNEVPMAKDLSDLLKIQNKNELINSDDFFESLDKVQYFADEPTANLSAVPLFFLSKLASKDVKVVLSGEGADELFGGYTSYDEDISLKKYKKLPYFLRHFIKTIVSPFPSFHGKNFLTKGGSKLEDYYVGNAFIFNNKEANNILSKEYQSNLKYQDITKPYFDKVAGEDDLTKMQYLDMYFWLPNDILLKADKMSMANSLELRVPILDKEVFALAKTIPTEYKLSHNTTKYILRKAASKRIPEAWYKRRKKGFPVPIIKWFREEKYYNIVKEIFEEDFTKEFFDQKKIIKMLDDHYKSKKNNCRKLWTIFVFLVWYKTFFIDFDNFKPETA